MLKKETLNYDDVEKLLGPPPHGNKRLIDPAEFEETLRKDVGDTQQSANAQASSTESQPVKQ